VRLHPLADVGGRAASRLPVSLPAAVQVHEVLAGPGIQVVLADPAGDRDGDADLPQVLGTALALDEMGLTPWPSRPTPSCGYG